MTTKNPWEDMEINLVEKWLRKDPRRWLAGLLGGLIAGLAATVFAMILARGLMGDFWYPPKHAATALLGAGATVEGFHLLPVFAGFAIISAVSMFWGFVLAHFVWTNSFRSLFWMGMTWGAFSWIFIWNLFSQSFKPIFAAGISSGASFLVCMFWGFCLTVIGKIDPVLKKT